MKSALRLLFALPLAVFVAASCSASSGNNSPGSGGAGGGTGGTAGTGGSTIDGGLCGFCVGKQYTPCIDGKQGTPVDCPEECSNTLGCVKCLPNQNTCVGNEVKKCAPDGQSAPDLVETCDTANGKLCSKGECKGACEIATESPSNVGCEFWAVDLDQQDGGGNDPASAPWGLVLSNVGDAPANVTVEINDAPPGQPQQLSTVKQVTVPAGGLDAFTLPTRELDCGTKPNDYQSPGTCLSSRAFRVRSSAPIVVYQFNVFANAYSNDASLLLPTNALGKFHRVIGWGAGHPVPINFPGIGLIIDRSYVTIVGTEANTQVTVKPSFRIKGNPPIAATQAGGDIVATLGPFDVLNLETDDATLNDPQETMADLTGTVVLSDKPVAVFSGVESTSAPGPFKVPTYPGWDSGDTCCLDHLEEQIFPMESLGKEYVLTRSPVRSTGGWKEPDVLRFVGVAEVAQVKTTLPSPYDNFTLNPGQIVTTSTQGDVIVTADKPIMVGQILISNQYCQGNYIGDPSLTVFPPVEQYRNDYVVLAPQGWTKQYVVIAAPEGAQIGLDGSPTSCPTSPAGTINGVNYEARTCPLTAGVHKLAGDKPFGIIVYGYGSAGSYAFVGGADVKKIYDPPIVK